VISRSTYQMNPKMSVGNMSISC